MQTYDNEGPPLAPSGDFGFAGESRWRTMPCTFCLPFCLLCRGKKNASSTATQPCFPLPVRAAQYDRARSTSHKLDAHRHFSALHGARMTGGLSSIICVMFEQKACLCKDPGRLGAT